MSYGELANAGKTIFARDPFTTVILVCVVLVGGFIASLVYFYFTAFQEQRTQDYELRTLVLKHIISQLDGANTERAQHRTEMDGVVLAWQAATDDKIVVSQRLAAERAATVEEGIERILRRLAHLTQVHGAAHQSTSAQGQQE